MGNRGRDLRRHGWPIALALAAPFGCALVAPIADYDSATCDGCTPTPGTAGSAGTSSADASTDTGAGGARGGSAGSGGGGEKAGNGGTSGGGGASGMSGGASGIGGGKSGSGGSGGISTGGHGGGSGGASGASIGGAPPVGGGAGSGGVGAGAGGESGQGGGSGDGGAAGGLDGGMPDAAEEDTGPSCPTYSAVVLGDHPVVYYRLGDSIGSATAVDATGHGHDGTYGSAVTRGVAGAIDCDTAIALSAGSAPDSLVTVPQDQALEPQGGFSLEVWASPQFGADGGTQFEKIIWYGPSSPSPFGLYGVQRDGPVFLAHMTIAGGSHFLMVGDITPGVWHHVVVTYDGLQVKTYLDGSVNEMQNASGSLGYGADGGSSSVGLALGASGDASGFFNGLVDEVAIYDVALTAAQVKSHFSARSP